MKHLIAMLAMSLLVGCALPKKSAEAPPPADARAPAITPAEPIDPPTLPEPTPFFADPRPAPIPGEQRLVATDQPVPQLDPTGISRRVYTIEIIELINTAGFVSADTELWPFVDETVFELARRDVLNKNGVRAGTIARTDLYRMERAIAHTARRQSAIIGPRGGDVELDIARNVGPQTIWWFDSRGRLEGRTFDESDYLLSMSFRPTPRQQQKITVELSPLVRSQRSEFRVTALGNDSEVKRVRPERIYDVGLEIDLPLDRALIVAPMPRLWEKSVGRVFFTKDAAAPRERVWLIVPTLQTDIRPNLEPRPSR